MRGEKFKEEIILKVVYLPYRNVTGTVHDVDFNASPKSLFRLSKNEMISIEDYYRTRYKMKLTDRDQPMLIMKDKKSERSGKAVRYM
jgi:hypothetical protein